MNRIPFLPLLALLAAIPPAPVGAAASTYFPPPDSQGGWRRLQSDEDIRRLAGLDRRKLDDGFEVAQPSTKNGGLLVLRHGWLAYERYYGKGHRDALCNLASCGKSFTSIAIGILMAERPEMFPEGLDEKIFTPAYLSPDAFPLSDPAKSGIKLGQLLAFSAGIRGNNPGYIYGKPVTLDPPGPDGFQAMIEPVAHGHRDVTIKNERTSTTTLWCEPGGGYSYATSAIHIGSMIVRHLAGMELKEYVRTRLAEPLGWGQWTYSYRGSKEIKHTPGGGGIALHATDMLRFGYLLLHEGRWQGRQIVPAEYVRHCRSQSPYNPHYPYSLQFNVNTRGEIPELPRDAFWKTGSRGHCIYVVPSADLVVWKLGGRDSQYGEADTGVPTPPHVRAAQKTVPGPTPELDRAVYTDVLRKVLDAIVEPGGKSAR